MESGWIYLSSGIFGLGRTGVYRCPVGQRAEPGSAASSPGACDEDIDPGVAAVPVCGCFCLFYAADRDQQKLKQWEETDAQIDKLSARLSSWISERVERRVKKAYPRVRKTEKRQQKK